MCKRASARLKKILRMQAFVSKRVGRVVVAVVVVVVHLSLCFSYDSDSRDSEGSTDDKPMRVHAKLFFR